MKGASLDEGGKRCGVSHNICFATWHLFYDMAYNAGGHRRVTRYARPMSMVWVFTLYGTVNGVPGTLRWHFCSTP